MHVQYCACMVRCKRMQKWPSLQREGQMKKREKCEYDKSNKEVVRYFLDGADEWGGGFS